MVYNSVVRLQSGNNVGPYRILESIGAGIDVLLWLDSLWRDLRHALRSLRRDWQFTLAAGLILALGIGANTAMFSIVNAALFRPQGYQDPNRLVNVYQNLGADRAPMGISFPVYEDIAEYEELFSNIAAVTFLPVLVRYQGEVDIRPAQAEFATSNYLEVVGLEPSAGRWFGPSADSAHGEKLAVLGYRTWQTKFDSDPGVLGRTIRINGDPVTIVGIGPRTLTGSANIGIVTDFWLSMSAVSVAGEGYFPPDFSENRGFLGLCGRARLREGVDLPQVQAALDNLAARLARDYPDDDPGLGITVLKLDQVRVHPQLDILLLPTTSILLGAVGLVLLIACSNLSTLLLVRGSARSREVGVRLALGAGRGQIIRHLLVENVVLALAGGVGGYILGHCVLRIMPRLLASLRLPVSVDFSLDYRVLGFTIALSVVSGVAIGLIPALKTTRGALVTRLRDQSQLRTTGRGRFTTGNVLVTVQVAASFLLLVGSGALLQSLMPAERLEMGFAVEGVAILETDARYAGYDTSEARAIYRELRDRIAVLPGVTSAALTRGSPVSDFQRRSLVIDGFEPDPGESSVSVSWGIAGPGYFDTLGIPVLYGRGFAGNDRADSRPVAVVNETMARRYFGTPNAVGHSFRLEGEQSRIQIIGVVASTRRGPSPEAPDPLFYTPITQTESPAATVLARASTDASGLVGAMLGELRALNAELPVIRAETMATHLDDMLAAVKIALGVVGTLALFGLLLATLGLYSIVAYAVGSRFREIGVRVALGARSSQVVGLVMCDAVKIIGIGLGMGLTLSVVVALVLDRLVLAVSEAGNIVLPTISFGMFALVAVTLVAVGSLGAYFPSRWAARVDPLRALRHE